MSGRGRCGATEDAASSDRERREAPEDWHADALPESHQFRTADAFPAAETTDKASKADDATTERGWSDRAGARARVGGGVRPRGSRRGAREGQGGRRARRRRGHPDAGVPPDKERGLEELKAGEGTVRLASQGEEF